jgi:hypothetical protein
VSAASGEHAGLVIRTVPRARPPETEIENIGRLFQAATSGGRSRPRRPRIPPEADLVRIASEMAKLKRPGLGPKVRRHVEMMRSDRAVAVRQLREAKAALQRVARNNGSEELGDFLDQMPLIEHILGAQTPKVGRSPVEWNRSARALAKLVGEALSHVGLPASPAEESTLVKIVCALLAEAYGREFGSAAVSSCLKRSPQR